MLDLMLGNASDAFSCGEIHAWFRPWRPHHFEIDCPCGEIPCPVWKKLLSTPENQIHAKIISEFGLKFVIDSSKHLCWVIDTQEWATENGITTTNLLLWKNPINLAYSYWKRGHDLAYWRRVFVRYHSRVFEIGLPFLAVNYNDLVINPQMKLGEICKAVGMAYFEGKERFWEKKHHHLFGSGGIRKQVETGNSIITAKETFSNEFDTHIGILQEQIAADRKVQHILEILRQFDVSSIDGENISIQSFLPKKPLPFWYYRKKMIRRLQRIFPENYDSSEYDHQETVPLEQK